MNYYVGVDLHSNNCYVAIIDETGTVKYKQRLANDANVILNALKIFKNEITGIVVESTFNWYWLVDVLKESGYRVHLANPSGMIQYSGIKHTDDKSDALWLAEMLRLNILPTGYIYPKKERAFRDLLRKRFLLVRHRTALLLSLKGTIHNWNGERLSRCALKDIHNSEIATMFDDERTILSATSINDIISSMNSQIEKIEKTILQEIKLKNEYKVLLSVWGIGPLLATTIMLETGDIKRFAEVGHYSSYCRCVSSQRISNDKKKGSGNKKNGNPYLAWAFIEAAYYMKRYYAKARIWFDKKSVRKGTPVATKALSNKIARACYFMMRDQTLFNPVKLFG